jgi:hypothetical protein
MKKLFIYLSVLLTLAAPVRAAELDNSERIFQATFGVITAFGLKKQIDADPNCKGRAFRDFDLNVFLDAIPKDFLTKPGQREGIINQFAGYFQQLDQIEFPSGKKIDMTYQDMKKSPAVVEFQQKQSADASAYCQKIFEMSGDIYQKQIDSIKQLVVKK